MVNLSCSILRMPSVRAGLRASGRLYRATTQPPPPAAGPPKPAEVLVDLPTTGRDHRLRRFHGPHGRQSRRSTIRARVTGYLEKINFKDQEGGDVEKGSVLFEIDPRPYEAEVARAKANLLQAEAHLKRLELDYERMARKLVASNTDQPRAVRSGRRRPRRGLADGRNGEGQHATWPARI